MDRTRPPGEKWQITSFPPAKGILDAWQNTQIRQVVEKAGSQTWKTTIMLIALAWSMRHRPIPKLWLTADNDLAKKASNRITAVFQRCPDVADIMLPGRRNNQTYQIQTMLGYLYIAGAESRTALEQEPAGEIFGDEWRNWPDGSLQKLKMRQRSYRDAKRALFSTPDRLGDAGDLEFLIGSQEEILFPCQGCQDAIPVVFSAQYSQLPENIRVKSQMMFPKGTREVWLECHCNHRHLDTPGTRRWILDHGIWQAMNASTDPEVYDPTVASFHWPAMINPKVDWFEVVKIFRKAMVLYKEFGITEDLKIFVNETLGESWEDGQQFARRAESASSFKLEDALTEEWAYKALWVDVQLHDFWHVALGFKLDGSSKTLSEGKLLTWGEIKDKEESLGIGGLEKNQRGQFTVKGFVRNPRLVFLDSRFNTDEVHRQCGIYGWTAMRGEDNADFRHKNGLRRLYSEPRLIDCGYDPETKQRLHCGEFLYATWTAEYILQHYLDGKGRKMEFHEGASPVFHKQIHARMLDSRMNKKTGRLEPFWKDTGQREYGPHMRDCLKGLLIFAAMEGLIAAEIPKPDRPGNRGGE